jgi:RNA polymerase sigma-70 factor (ECF subfamily)
MTRAKDEREGRFERLFEATRADILAYSLRRVSSPEEAADVLSETFLIAWRKLDALPPGDEARLWLFGVARNVLRRGATRERVLQVGVERLAAELSEAVSTSATGEGRARSPGLRAALEALPEPQREAILLTAWEGLSPREIAAVTRTPVNLVRVRLHRARTRLRRELAAEDVEAPTRESPASPGDCPHHTVRVRAALDSTTPR